MIKRVDARERFGTLAPTVTLATEFDRLMTISFCILRKAPAPRLRTCALALSVLCLASPAAFAGDEPGALTQALGLRTTVPQAPEFIVKTRPKTEEFIPVHAPRNKPGGKPMTKDEVSRQEKSLDAARSRHDRLARRGAAEPEKSVADEMDPKAPQPRAKRPPCGLTCPNPALLPSQAGKEAR